MWRVVHLPETTSTQDLVAAAARRGEAPGFVVWADHQSAGRGRQGRSWLDRPGDALLCSALVEVPCSEEAFMVSFVAALAASDAIEERCGIRPGLKWPNDLVMTTGGRLSKMGGLLVEGLSGRRGLAVVGLGVNLRGEPPKDVRVSACSVESAGGVAPERIGLLASYLDRLRRLLRILSRSDGIAQLLDLYRSRCVSVGAQVEVCLPGRIVLGRARGVAHDGRLVVETVPNGELLWLSAGEVRHLAEPGGRSKD